MDRKLPWAVEARYGKIVKKDTLKEISYTMYLNSLKLVNCNLIEGLEGLENFRRHGRLVEVDLSGTNVRDSDIYYLSCIKNLSRLNLSGTKITDVGMEDIKLLQRLRFVILDNTRVTNQGIKNLSKLYLLKKLSFVNTLVTREVLKDLEYLIRLEDLRIGNGEVNIRASEVRMRRRFERTTKDLAILN